MNLSLIKSWFLGLAQTVNRLISRGVLETAETEGRLTTITGRLHAGERLEGMEQFQIYGHFSVPPEGAEFVALDQGGDRRDVIVIGSEHRLHRPQGEEPGASGLYSSADPPAVGEELPEDVPGFCRLVLKPDGSAVLYARRASMLSLGDFAVTGDSEINLTGGGGAKLTAGAGAEINGATVQVNASGEARVTAGSINLSAANIVIGAAGANVTIAGIPVSEFARLYRDCALNTTSGEHNGETYPLRPDCGDAS